MVRQVIEIVTRMIDRLSGPVRRMNASLGKFHHNLNNRVGGALKRNNEITRENIKTLGGFNFAWLSVMFAGMAVYRVFGGIIRQQNELWGISDMFSSMLTVVMIPAMELLSAVLFPVFEFFMNLPEPIQKIIGLGVIFGAILGGIAMVAGMVVLGIAGILSVGGGVFLTLIAVVSGFILALSGIILIVKGIYDIFKGKLEGIGLIIMGIGAILFLIIGGWIPALITAIGAAVYFIIKHFDAIKDFIWNVLKAIGGFFKTWFWDKPKEYISKLVPWIIDKFKSLISFLEGVPILGGIIKMNKSAYGWLGGVLGSFQTGGVVPETGPYMLHKGETVVPNSGGSSNPTIVVNATVSSDYDVRRLADQLKRYWVSDFERVSGGKTV